MTKITYIAGINDQREEQNPLSALFHYNEDEAMIGRADPRIGQNEDGGDGDSGFIEDLNLKDVTGLIDFATNAAGAILDFFGNCDKSTCDKQSPEQCYQEQLNSAQDKKQWQIVFTAYMLWDKEEGVLDYLDVGECDKNKQGAKVKTAVWHANQEVNHGNRQDVPQKYRDMARQKLEEGAKEKDGSGNGTGDDPGSDPTQAASFQMGTGGWLLLGGLAGMALHQFQKSN